MKNIKILDNSTRIKMWCYVAYNSYLFSPKEFITLIENLIQYYAQDAIDFDDMQSILYSIILLGKRETLLNDVEQFKNEGYKNYGFELPNIDEIDEQDCFPIKKYAQEIFEAFSPSSPKNIPLQASYNAFICENQICFDKLIPLCDECKCCD